jgi:hypothetical protein
VLVRCGAASLRPTGKQCDSAAEHGRKYCLAHLASKFAVIVDQSEKPATEAGLF